MKNLIRKILKEEFNNINWIKDTLNTKLAGDENWILVNDVDRESIAEGHEIQKYLFDLGYDWSALSDFQSLKDFCIYTIYHYGTLKDGNQIFYQDGCRGAEVRISDKDIKSGEYMVYYWSDLKPKTIKESEELEQYRVLAVNQLKSSGIGKKVKIAAEDLVDDKKKVTGVYIIGSVLDSNKFHEESDIDIAILLNEPNMAKGSNEEMSDRFSQAYSLPDVGFIDVSVWNITKPRGKMVKIA